MQSTEIDLQNDNCRISENNFPKAKLKPENMLESKSLMQIAEIWKLLKEYFNNPIIIDGETLTPKLSLGSQIIHQGFMFKRGGLLSLWKQRYFCLCADSTLRVINNDGNCYWKIDLTTLPRLPKFSWDSVDCNGTIKLWCIQRNWKFMLNGKSTFEAWKIRLEHIIRKRTFEQSHILCSGYVDKKGLRNKSWKRRWCQLNRNGIFSYFKTKNGIAKGSFDLQHCSELIINKYRNGFSVVTHHPRRTWYFKTQKEADAKRWIHAIKEFCEKLVVVSSSKAEGPRLDKESEESFPTTIYRNSSVVSGLKEDNVFSKGHHRIDSSDPLKLLHLKPQSRIHLRSVVGKFRSSRHDKFNTRDKCSSVPCRKYVKNTKPETSHSNMNMEHKLQDYESVSAKGKDANVYASKLNDRLHGPGNPMEKRPSLALIYPSRFLESKRKRESLRTSLPTENDIYNLVLTQESTGIIPDMMRVTSKGQSLTSGRKGSKVDKSDKPLILLHSGMIRQKWFSESYKQLRKREWSTLEEKVRLDSESEGSAHSDSDCSQLSLQSHNYSADTISDRVDDWSYNDVLRSAFYRFAGVSPYSNTNLKMSEPDLNIFLECLGLEKHCDDLYSSLETDINGLIFIGDFMDVFLNSETCNLITNTNEYRFLVVTLIEMKNFDPSYSKRVSYCDFLNMLSDFFTEEDSPEEIFAEYDTDGVGFMHVANLFCFFHDFFDFNDDQEVDEVIFG